MQLSSKNDYILAIRMRNEEWRIWLGWTFFSGNVILSMRTFDLTQKPPQKPLYMVDRLEHVSSSKNNIEKCQSRLGRSSKHFRKSNHVGKKTTRIQTQKRNSEYWIMGMWLIDKPWMYTSMSIHVRVCSWKVSNWVKYGILDPRK